MLFENRLLYTGITMLEAEQKAQTDADRINQNISIAIGRTVIVVAVAANTAFPEIEGQTAFFNVAKPLQYHIEHFNAMDGVNNYYAEALYDPSWNLPIED